MPGLVRTIAVLLALGVMSRPVFLALFVASIEPSRAIKSSWVAPYALGGLGAAVGYWVIATVPHRIARAAFELRLLVACLMAIPCAVALYLLTVTDAKELVGLCLGVLAGTVLLIAACVWPAWLAAKGRQE